MAVLARPQDLFAADSDVAALVYGPGQDPDTLLRRFVADLTGSGVRVAGLLQRRSPGAAVNFTLLPGARPVGNGVPCADALSAAERTLLAAVRRQPDLLVVNRFGSAELGGGGLLGVLVEAVARGIPVLIAVPRGLFDEWLGFSGGLTVRLDCRRSGLERWWASLAKPLPATAGGQTVCEHVK